MTTYDPFELDIEMCFLFCSWQKADTDGNGSLNCEEFITMNVHLGKIGSDEHLSEAFSYFDKNRSGYVEFDELREALLDDNLDNDQVVHDIIFEVDLDKVTKNGLFLCSNMKIT